MVSNAARSSVIAALLVVLSTTCALAAQTVKINIPVDLENVSPNIESFSISCHFTVGTDVTTDYSPGRYDQPVSGSFKGTVVVPLTWDGTPPAPTGYRCQLYLFRSTGGMGFQPTSTDAKPGTTLVTDIQANFTQRMQVMPIQLNH